MCTNSSRNRLTSLRYIKTHPAIIKLTRRCRVTEAPSRDRFASERPDVKTSARTAARQVRSTSRRVRMPPPRALARAMPLPCGVIRFLPLQSALSHTTRRAASPDSRASAGAAPYCDRTQLPSCAAPCGPFGRASSQLPTPSPMAYSCRRADAQARRGG